MYQIYDPQCSKIIISFSSLEEAKKEALELWEAKMKKYKEIDDPIFWSFCLFKIIDTESGKVIDTYFPLPNSSTNYEYVAFYKYGSRVFGTAHEESDYDYIIVVKEEPDVPQKSVHDIDISYYSQEKFQQLINDYHLFALSCYFLSDEHVILQPEQPWELTMDRQKFRIKISQAARYSFHKCKMKMMNEDMDNDQIYYIAKKSLYHSIRILMFGVQIANEGKICDYHEAKHIFEKVMSNDSREWDVYSAEWDSKFKKHLKILHNAIPKVRKPKVRKPKKVKD